MTSGWQLMASARARPRKDAGCRTLPAGSSASGPQAVPAPVSLRVSARAPFRANSGPVLRLAPCGRCGCGAGPRSGRVQCGPGCRLPRAGSQARRAAPSAVGRGGLGGSSPRLGCLRARPWAAGAHGWEGRVCEARRREGVVAELTLPCA